MIPMKKIRETQEKDLRARIRKGEIQKTVLKTVAAVGILAVALLAPNAMQILNLFGGKRKRNLGQAINTSRRRLVAHGLLQYKNGFLELTKKGTSKLEELERREYRLPIPSRWDKKWRVLVFDIPEHKRVLRNKIRLTLASIGFKRLQQSVWVYPYDCEDLITLIKADFKIGKDLLYLIVDSIENDHELKSFFDLEK